MGVFWSVFPLDDEMKSWLDSEGFDYPDEPSRNPTGAELKAAIGQLQGVRVKVTDHGVDAPWQAWLESEFAPEEQWTMLNVSNYSGDDLPQEVWFDKGDEALIKIVLAAICAECGPLVLIAEDEVQVITA